MAQADLSPWLHGRSFADVWEQYQEEGYVIFPEVLTAAQLEQQLRSLQLAERNYCDMKMQNSTVYAEILHSMAHTMKLLGKVVPAAVRSGEAVLVAKNAKEHALPARNKRRKGPPLPPRAFVDSDADW